MAHQVPPGRPEWSEHKLRGRKVRDEDKDNRVGGQIICNSKLSALSPDLPSMFFHFLFSDFFSMSLLSPDIQKEAFYMCGAFPEGHTVQILELGYMHSNPDVFMYLWASSPAFLCFIFFI